jgi:hypothetical protein
MKQRTQIPENQTKADKRRFLDLSHGRTEFVAARDHDLLMGIVYRLWDSPDPLPKKECRRQGMPMGSTWGDAMRSFLNAALRKAGYEVVRKIPEDELRKKKNRAA